MLDYYSLPSKRYDEKKETANYFKLVYLWLSLGLLCTAVISYYASQSHKLMQFIFFKRIGNIPYNFYGLIIIEVIVAIIISTKLLDIPLFFGYILYFLYCSLIGLVISSIFLVFDISTIYQTFAITSITFFVMSIYGFVTKNDLSNIGSTLFCGLLAIIFGSLLNMVLKSQFVDWIITYIGIIVFTIFIAYDTQKIKKLNELGNDGTDENTKEAILGAFTLYLDFINLFLKLLKARGSKK